MGKKITPWPLEQYYELKNNYRRLVLDIGTGDGKHAIRWAQQHPDDYVLGIDASWDSLLKNSRKTGGGKRENVAFIRSAAQELPVGLGLAHEIHILMPWGSLLRDIVIPSDRGDAFVHRLRQLCAPGAVMTISLNLHAWNPPVPEVGDSPQPDPNFAQTVLIPWYARHGFEVHTLAELGPEYSSSWTKRLASSRDELQTFSFRALAR